jgi:hypothetical protein
MSKKYLKVPYHKEETGMLVVEVDDDFCLEALDGEEIVDLMSEAVEQSFNSDYNYDIHQATIEDEEVI